MRTPQKFARPVGAVLVAASFLYLGHELLARREALATYTVPLKMWGLFAGLSFVYGTALLLLAEQWHRIITIFGAEPRRRTWPSYTSTLIARYLPGNVFHIVGRAGWLRGGAIKDGALIRASIIELALTPAAAGLVLLSLLSMSWPSSGISVILAGFGALAFIFAHRTRRVLIAWSARLAPPLLFGVAFMIILAVVFTSLAAAVATVPLGSAASAALVGWLVGYATPGAPSGIGTREATIVALLSSEASSEAALFSAILFRGVTILGDIICFAGWIAFAVRDRLK